MARKKKSPTENEMKQALQFFRKNELTKAKAACVRVFKRNPKDFDACFMLGLIALKNSDAEQASTLLTRATRLRINSSKAWGQLGVACWQTGDVETAIAALREAIRLKPDYLEACEMLTLVLESEGRYQALVDVCHDAIGSGAVSVEIYSRLAGALERLNRLEEAEAIAEKALNQVPGHARAQLTLAKIDRRQERMERARDRLRTVLGGQLSPVQYSAVAGELGDVLDRLGDFTAAFQAYERGNGALLRTVQPGLLQHNPILASIKRYRSYYSAQAISAWAAEDPDDKLDSPLFLVGFPRSGTTLTEQILTATDGVQASDEQPVIGRLISELPELAGPAFSFPEGLTEIPAETLARLRSRYWELVHQMCGDIAAGKRFLDKLPLNIIELGFIYRLFPRSPVLVMLRDPRDCCLSCFMKQFILNDSMVNFTTVEQTSRFYAAAMGLWLYYRDTLPLNFKVLRYEDLVCDLEGSARSLLAFFGLEWSEAVLRFFEKVRERDVRTPSYSAIASPIYNRAVGRWKSYRQQLAPMRHDLTPFIKAFGYEDW